MSRLLALLTAALALSAGCSANGPTSAPSESAVREVDPNNAIAIRIEALNKELRDLVKTEERYNWWRQGLESTFPDRAAKLPRDSDLETIRILERLINEVWEYRMKLERQWLNEQNTIN